MEIISKTDSKSSFDHDAYEMAGVSPSDGRLGISLVEAQSIDEKRSC